MAVNTTFFSKREPQNFAPRSPSGMGTASSHGMAPAGPNAAAVAASSLQDPQVRTLGAEASASADVAAQGGSKLTVGPNIKLKGVEITDCDTLVVEGTVEATMDSRVIHIAQQGAFHGSAEIDIAEIHGQFTGSLTVRQKLVIHSTGKVSGKIRYGNIVIEEGGQLSGEIEVGVGRSDSSNNHSAAHSPSQAAASSKSVATPAAQVLPVAAV